MKRKLLSVLLTLCLAFSLLPTAALADGEGTQTNDVAQIGETKYATLQEAVIAANDNTVKLLENVTEDINIPTGINVTLDLNGHKITNVSGHTITVEKGGKLNISDSVGTGVVDNTSHGKGAIVNSGEVTLNGGTFKRSAENGTYSPYGNGGNSWYTIANYGTMEINTGVTVENAGGYSSMIRNGGEATADCNLTIRGGNFTGGINTVKNDLFGVLTINGGNFSNTAQYVIMNWNKAEITAGTFQALDTASAVLFTSAFGSNANYVGELTISGGEFKHASDTQEMIVDHYDASNSGTAAVTGGKFDADISAYVPDGYILNNGTVEKLGETNAVAKVGGTYYKTLADAVAAAQDGDTITLLKDAELTSTLNLAKNITIDGQGKYTIKAANSFTVGSDNKTYCVLYVSGEVTLKDVTVNGNEKCRVIFCDKGKLTIDGATITNGKAPNFIGGVYMTSSASFEMKSGSITGNKNAKGYQNDEYLQYSSDLWIGANANGALTAINGGTIGNVFVNANAWSASNPGSFTMNGGTVTNLYVEHDDNYGATFKYNDGTIEHLYLSKENGNGQSIEVTPVKGVIYNGGVKEQDLVTLTMKYNDGATADSTYNVASGTTITLPTPRRSGYTFNGWYDGSKFYAAGASYTVSATVTLNASWSYISSGSSSYDPTYSVSTPSKTENGSVTVSPKSASKGSTVTITVKPDSGYVLETLTVTDKNGNELTLKDKGDGKYTFTMPAGKVEVKATFMEDNSMLNFFYDVPNNAYFYEAVKWAVKNGITDGVGNNLFAPEQPCTRAQIVTFLWRAAGSPEPKGAASGMTDVVSGSYYEKAVAWAIENGITTGTTTSTFSPDATCTRAQAVTFLARALKAKAASAAEFSDVPTGSYFADAVAWAAANGVTEGIGGGLFGSDNDCTRGQIVTFLYRAYNK